MDRTVVSGAVLLSIVAACASPPPRPAVAGRADPVTEVADWGPVTVENRSDLRYTLLHLPDGRSFETTLFEVDYLGHLPASTRTPYLVLAGYGCPPSECDASIAIHVHSPDDGPMVIEPLQRPFAHPGTLFEFETDRPVQRTRFFLGDCLGGRGPVALWFIYDLTAADPPPPKVMLVEVEGDALRLRWLGEPLPDPDALVPEASPGRCREIEGGAMSG